MALELKPGQPANLLCLDGGGIKGISTLVIIEAIMAKVQEIEDGNTLRKSPARLPVDYFHLAAGTSTGGIIALMLFRLRMSPAQAKDAYNKMAKRVFGTKSSGASAFSDGPLIQAIDDIVAEYGPTPEDKQAKGAATLVNNKAKMFMLSTLQERGESILLRSYSTPEDAIPISKNAEELFKMGIEEFGTIEGMSISIAARATSAAPTYFPEVHLDVKSAKVKRITFWDGGLLNNNPIDQIWRARLDLVGQNDPPPKVACILSLGTSWSNKPPPSKLDSKWVMGFVKDFILKWFPIITPAEKSIAFLTNTEARHLDFGRYIRRISHRTDDRDAQTKYFRLNPPTNDLYIDMAEWEKMDQLAKITQDWLNDATDDGGKKKLEEVAKLLAKKKPSGKA